MHDGTLPNFLDKLVPGNYGLVAPIGGFFPNNARGVVNYNENSTNFIASPLVISSELYQNALIRKLYKPGISYINTRK